ncbi:MAG: phytanoyl-CoA dioxygenase family protein, partial [Actinobacteria bacterium]|nr:phytanoyl-CoA dioxygenase family protein [Actinomycetota bacterium]
MADQDVLEGVQASLDRLGYAILPLLTTDEVARLRAQFDELHPTPGAGFETDFERSDAGFKAGVTETTRWVWDRVAPHLPGYEPFMASYLVKWPTPDSHLDLHADWTYTDERVQPSFAAWIPLVDTGPDLPNGPLLVVPGSHRLVQSWRGTATPAWYEAGREGFLAAAVPVTAPAGCVVLFDNRILHHSPPNLGSEPRPVLAGAFVPIGATLLHVVGDGGPMARVIEVEPSFFAAHNPSGLRLERPDVPDDALEVPLVDGSVDPIGLAADHGIDDAGCFHDGEPRPGDRRWDQPTGPLDLDRHRARLGTALDLSTVPWAPTTVDADPDARTQLVLLAGARPTPSGSELLGSSAASGAWWSLRLVRVPPGATVDLAPTGTGRAGQVAVLGLGPDDPALLVEGASGWASVAGASAVLVPDEAIRVRNRSSHEVAALVGEPLPPAGRLPEGLHARLLWRRAGRDRWQQA